MNADLTSAVETADVTPVLEAAEPAAEIDALRTELAEARRAADENNARWLLALADFENYKKRGERQLHERLAAGKKATLAKFLSVLDNLERALSFEQDSAGLRAGLQATQRGFEGLLAGEGVQALSVLNAPFDPRVAEAVGTRETADVDDDVVVEEIQRGYTLGDELLRPAQVIVAKRADAPDGESLG